MMNTKMYFDNIIYYLQRSGGGSVYWNEITKQFRDEPNATFIQIKKKPDNIIYERQFYKNILFERCFSTRFLRYVPLTIPIQEDSIFHSSYYRYSAQQNIKNVVTVHDFVHEKFYSGLPKIVNHLQKRSAISHAKGIICISENTKNDLIKYFPQLIKNKIIEVIYNGVSNDFNLIDNNFRDYAFYVQNKLIDGFKYILFVGHRSHYKNFYFAIEVIRDLPKDYKLIIVGNQLNQEELKILNLKIPNRYTFLGNISNQELNLVYNIAFCLIYPSSYEGFGIPIIEAFRCGCPVVAQRLPIFEEISNNTMGLTEGLNKKFFIENIKNLDNDKYRSELQKSGIEQSKKYSWDKCSQEVNNFYKIL